MVDFRNRLRITVRHDMHEFKNRIGFTIPRLVREALYEATIASNLYIERFWAEEMVRVAGGKYWDIHKVATRGVNGVKGIVWTHANRPHRINPRQPGGHLIIGGRLVSGGIDHPGSRPIDVITPLKRRGVPRITGNYRDEIRKALRSGVRSAMPRGGL